LYLPESLTLRPFRPLAFASKPLSQMDNADRAYFRDNAAAVCMEKASPDGLFRLDAVRAAHR
jgi:hypothetical protein